MVKKIINKVVNIIMVVSLIAIGIISAGLLYFIVGIVSVLGL